MEKVDNIQEQICNIRRKREISTKKLKKKYQKTKRVTEIKNVFNW